MSTELAAVGRRDRGRNAIMSTHVVTQLHAKPGRGDDVEGLLLEILGESLKHQGCEAIRITRDQDNPDHVVAFTLWTERHHYDDYLAWRTARGFTGTFEAMLTGPLVINYYDEVFYSPGVAASPSVPAAGA
jgi:quinol monooxygenase YgiN